MEHMDEDHVNGGIDPERSVLTSRRRKWEQQMLKDVNNNTKIQCW